MQANSPPIPPLPPNIPHSPKSRTPLWTWILVGCLGGGCVLFVLFAAIVFPMIGQAYKKVQLAEAPKGIAPSSVQHPEEQGWNQDYHYALEKAHAVHKPLFINFTGAMSTESRMMESDVLTRADVKKELQDYVLVALTYDVDTPGGQTNRDIMSRLAPTAMGPVYVCITPGEKVISKFEGVAQTPQDIERFLIFLHDGKSLAGDR